jgi:hypothetical protein
VTVEDLVYLKKEGLGMKKVAVMEALIDVGTSWDNLEIRVFETMAADEEANNVAVRLKVCTYLLTHSLTHLLTHLTTYSLTYSLKTDAGKERQRIVLEHSEDIEEMTQFFKNIGTYSLTHLTIYSLTHLTIYSLTHLTIYSLTHLTTYSLTHLTIYSLTHLTIYSLTHLTIYSLTHLTIYSLI